jgi:hypothetical protein
MSKDNFRLNREDFQGKPEEWIEKLITPLNSLSDKTKVLDKKGLGLLGFDEVKIDVTTVNDWTEIGTNGAPVFKSSWTNFGTPYETAAYRKDQNGMVHLKGRVKSGTVGASAIFTLPSNCWPASNGSIEIPVSSNGAFGVLRILNNPSENSTRGDVQLFSGSNTYASIRCSFEASDRAPGLNIASSINFKTSVKNVMDVQVAEVRLSDNSMPAVSAVGLDYEVLKDGRISIRNITGLPPNSKYKVTVLVYPR